MQAPPAVQGCLEACRRCRELVETIAGQQPDAYAAVGPHMRHCVDHFLCLLRGVDSGAVDYDARARDPRLESEPQHFLNALESVVCQLQSVEASDLGRELRMRQEVGPGSFREVGTNLERELVFLSGHTIHHIAIMTLLVEARGVELPPGLGVAFSTETFLQRPHVSEAG